MSKQGKKYRKFKRFVDGLSEGMARDQLIMAYMQMERCQQLLRGNDVEPVEMLDNGESSDLELFYLCKKLRDELDRREDGGDTAIIVAEIKGGRWQ